MSIVLVTGSAGLIGSESVKFFCIKGYDVVGIDNDMRQDFFGPEASTAWNKAHLVENYPTYHHLDIDIRDERSLSKVFAKYANAIKLIIHAAAQPSHDWAANDPLTDFSVNASGTLIMLENFRRHCPEAVFIFTSTNKVYGDLPNTLPLKEQEMRYEIEASHRWHAGINEAMSIDNCLHSLFGASKVAADILVQEYGKYFKLKTGVFRGGCLSGPAHSGTRLHGFLSYLMRCCISGKKYFIYGYKGKQVRDNIHSYDLVNSFYHYFKDPRCGEVYNIGGGRASNCSILEGMALCERVSGKKLQYEYISENRTGDHMWWISDIRKFKSHYPDWQLTYDTEAIIEDIHNVQKFILS